MAYVDIFVGNNTFVNLEVYQLWLNGHTGLKTETVGTFAVARRTCSIIAHCIHTVYIETGRRPNRPPIGGSGRLLFPTAGAAGGARFVYTAAAVLYTHYTASTNYLPLALMSSQFDWHCHCQLHCIGRYIRIRQDRDRFLSIASVHRK